jgi:protein phosphatase 1D
MDKFFISGDLWSYNYASGDYAVSPEPDLHCMHLDPKKHVCLILGSDGLWNMMSPQEAVNIVEQVENEIEQKFLHDPVSIYSHPKVAQVQAWTVVCKKSIWYSSG